MRILIALGMMIMTTHFVSAQMDSTLFMRIKMFDTANTIRVDTLSVPEDRFTEKIRQLQHMRGGLNARKVIVAKLKEEAVKDTIKSKDFYNALIKEVTTGHTSQLLENSLINQYRQEFTEADIDAYLKFYNTPAGKKMDQVFFIIVFQSMRTAEQLIKHAGAGIEANMMK